MTSKTTSNRLEGLDVARYLAFVGMVLVNFKTVLQVDALESSWATVFAGAFEGRAAATFVVLAGLGLGLAYGPDRGAPDYKTIIKRAVFLLVFGFANALIFEADILHYYAFYFLFGALFLRSSVQLIGWVIVGLIVGFVVALMLLNYDAGWDWETLTYTQFWEPVGMVRNLFFNGWHPVLPWLAFFLFGIVLSRQSLGSEAFLKKLAFCGLVVFVATELLSGYLVSLVPAGDPDEIALLFMTKPVPPVPLYMLAGMSAASAVIAVCLLLENKACVWGFLKVFTPAGRQTLTLYIAHIMVGMGLMDAYGLFKEPQSAELAVGWALAFSCMAFLYALLWSRFFKRGPVEGLMRLLTK